MLASACVVIGIAFLFMTTGLAPRLRSLWPLIPAFLAVCSLYLIILKNLRKKFLFVSLLILLCAIILQLIILVPLPVRKVWPLFVLASGLSVLPAGYLRYKRLHPVYFVPGTAFLILGTLFSIFSFGQNSVSFRSFLAVWWPAFIMAAGIFLYMIYIVNKSHFKHKHQNELDHDEMSIED